MDNYSEQPFDPENVEQQVKPIALFAVFLAVILGVVAALVIMPVFLPGMAQSILAAEPKVFWYLSRGSALVAYGLLWLSMALGVGVTNKMATRWPGLARTNELHQFVSILGLAFGLFHGLILLGDQYSNFSLAQILVPFTTANFLPFFVGLGQIGFYLWLIILVSFYIRRLISHRIWRFVHYFSYITFLSVLIHGLASGTDANVPSVQFYYWISGGLLLFLTVYRVLYEMTARSIKDNKAISN